MMKSSTSALKIVMDPFCYKQFDAVAARSSYINFDRDEFTQRVNDYYLEVKDKGGLKDGYAPFCKHLHIANFTDAISGFLSIDEHNEKFIRTGYEARRENELAVLGRWFERKLLEDSGYKFE